MDREEALKIVRDLYEKSLFLKKDKEAVATLIPELKESEDERIRKTLIEGVSQIRCKGDITREQMIVYLEKQKDEAQKQFNLGVQAGREEVMYEMEKEQEPAECIEFDNEFKNQVSHLLASVLNKEWEYDKGFVEYAAQQLLGYAKHEIKSAEWSNEDENCRHDILLTLEALCSSASSTDTYIVYKRLIDWLKSLSERFNLQPKQEWNKEDELNLYNIIEAIKYAYDVSEGSSGSRLIAWLKFHLRPQSHWKPSEEQMRAVFDASERNDKLGSVLSTLYNDLKKL